MTPDKRVEDLVEEMFDTEYFGGKQPNLNKVWLRQALTQHNQSMMSELVEELDNLANIYSWHKKECFGHSHNPSCPVVKLRRLIIKSLSE